MVLFVKVIYNWGKFILSKFSNRIKTRISRYLLNFIFLHVGGLFMGKRFFMLLVSLVFILIVSACSISFGGDSDGKEAEEAEEVSKQDDASDEDESEDEQTEDDASDNEMNDSAQTETDSSADENQQTEKEESIASDEQDLPEPIVLNERVEDPIGVIFELEEITFEENHILVSFTAENHSGFTQYLAAEGAAYEDFLGGVTLEDDTGFFYRYNAGEDSMISIKDRERITAKVSFTGRIKDDAEFITLKFNEGEEPEFIFEDLEIVR